MAKKQHLINIIILFLLAISVRIAISSFHGFDGLYGQDAFAYYDFAGELVNFVKARAIPPPFFWSIGYPLQLAIGFSIFGISESVALGISIVMGSLLASLVYILSIQLHLRPAYAFVAGLLVAYSGQALQSSLVIMSDIPALTLALISLVAILQYLKTMNTRWIPICVIAVALASITRWLYLILPPIYLLAILMVWKRNIRWKDLILSVLFAVITVTPQIVFNQVNPTPLLDHSWVQGWSPLNAIAQDFVNVDGTFNYETINAIFYAYPIYDISYLSPILTFFAVFGCISFIRTQKSDHRILILGLLSLPYLFLIGIPYQNIRFPLIIYPIIAIFVAFALQRIATMNYPTRWLGLIIGLIGLSHTAIGGFDYANSFINHHQSEKAIVSWLDDTLPDNATLYTMGSTLTLEHYTDLSTIEIFYETPNTLNQRWFRGREDYLLLNIWQIENQWQGRDPQLNYHWFRDERGLTELGRFGHLTLFEANP